MDCLNTYKTLFNTHVDGYSRSLEKSIEQFKQADSCRIIGPSLFLVLNVEDFSYAFVGNVFKPLLGYSEAVLFEDGINFFLSIMHPKEKNVVVNMVWRELLEHITIVDRKLDFTKVHFQLTYRLRHADGHYIQVQESQTPLMVESGKVVLGVSRIDTVSCPTVLAVTGRILYLNQQNNYETLFFKDYSMQQYAEILTPRELEVAKCLVKSMSSKEIGNSLFLSPHTVDTYRRRILKKLNLASTSQLWQ